MALEAFSAAPEEAPSAWCTGTLQKVLQENSSVFASFSLSGHLPNRCSAITGFHAKVVSRATLHTQVLVIYKRTMSSDVLI